MTATTASRVALAAVLSLTALLGARDISDPASVMLTADMSRYMMNGVFVHDLIADGGVWTLADLTTYAERYFARYPALTLGHHPPVPYLAVVPFYAVFGISVLAARLTALCWFLLAAWALFMLGRRMYDWRVGAWASALFVTNVMALRAGQHLLSEMPMVALVLVAINALITWRETRRPVHLAAFVVAAVASVYAKQLAALMFPTYAAIVLATLGWRGVANRRVLMMAGAAALLAVPMLMMSVGFGPANLALATDNLQRLLDGTRDVALGTILRTIVTTHLSLPALVTVVVATAVMAVRRPKATAIVLAWMASVIGSTAIIAYTIEPARYAFGALPAYYLLTSSLVEAPRTRPWAIAVAALLSSLLAWQAWTVRYVRPTGAGGYEEAARYVVQQSREPVVLFHGMSDTGYFMFFVRRHDAAGRMIVMRAEKLFPGGRPTADGLYSDLQRFGVQFVVVEEREADTAALRMLHRELETNRFAERRRIPIVTRQPDARGVDLVVYEFLDARVPDSNAEVDIGVRRANRTIRVPMRDLLAPAPR